jgi:hypothetical protein
MKTLMGLIALNSLAIAVMLNENSLYWREMGEHQLAEVNQNSSYWFGLSAVVLAITLIFSLVTENKKLRK